MIPYPSTTSRGAHNPFTPATGVVQEFRDVFHEAIVVDVVVNEKHPEYSTDGYNIGAVAFRSLKSDQYRSAGQLNWALPFESNITEYPLPGEPVLVFACLNRFYYSRKINTSNRVTTQVLDGIDAELSLGDTDSEKSERYRKSAAPTKSEAKNSKPASQFQEQAKVFRLRHDAGDIVFEGRSGQSIRFGAAWKTGTNFRSIGTDQAPNILFRVGPDLIQTPSVAGRFGLVIEDVNADATSVYLVADQVIPLAYATAKASIHGASVQLPPRLDGGQIVMNADRLVLNAKKNELLGFSNLGIHWTANRDFTVDADRDYSSKISRDQVINIGRSAMRSVGRNVMDRAAQTYQVEAGSQYSVVAPKVYVGTQQSQAEPVACGALLAHFLEKIIDAFVSNAGLLVAVTASPGAPSSLNPAIVAKLAVLKADVAKGAHASFNSAVAYTTK